MAFANSKLCVRHHAGAVEYAPAELLEDRAVALRLVRASAQAFLWLPSYVEDDHEIALEAVRKVSRR